MKHKKIIPVLVAALSAACICGCGKPKEVPVIHLSLWGNENNTEFLRETVEAFNNEHADEVKLECTISVQGEDTCKAVVLSNPENAADIYSFADDQTSELIKAGALLANTYDPENIIEASGGKDAAAVKVITYDNKIYAYPQTAGNGYYLYYNKKYYTEDDVKTLDRIIDIAAENNKKFMMNISNGWYLYSFFKGAGLELVSNADGSSNICNWNATDTKYKGTDVAESLLLIAGRDGFLSVEDDAFVEGIKDGSVIAGVNGPWNAENISRAWGEDFAAAKLPTYTVAGDQVQMYSFSGFKLLGINSHTENPEWCMKLASYITNEENQLKLFETTGECPVNTKAAASENVQNSPSVAALSQQSQFSTTQNVAASFWDASNRFGITISGGNKGGRDLQELLDEMTRYITSVAE